MTRTNRILIQNETGCQSMFKNHIKKLCYKFTYKIHDQITSIKMSCIGEVIIKSKCHA